MKLAHTLRNPPRGAVALLGLGAALVLNTAAIAGDLPKEGTYNVTYSASGTFKTTAIGKQRLLVPLHRGLDGLLVVSA